MSETVSVIRTRYATREHLLQHALDRLRRLVQAYIALPFPEAGSPRAEIDGFIFEAMDTIEYARDKRSILYLAVEDLALLEKQPDALDVSDDDPPWAEYVIRQNFEAWITEQLGRYADAHPLCCEVCGRETATWLWFPFIYIANPDLDLLHLPPSCRWGIGESCRSALLAQGSLQFWNDDHWHVSGSSCLVQLEPLPVNELPPLEGVETPLGNVPPGYLTLAQRTRVAHRLFDGWLAHLYTTQSKEDLKLQEVKRAIEQITLMVAPHTWRDPLPLLLLALEEPTLAKERPADYATLVEERAEERGITAAYLLWAAVLGTLSAALLRHWQKHAAPSVS